jgi:hypothetical protein
MNINTNLLQLANLPNTPEHQQIANIIILVYNNSKNLFEADAIAIMQDYAKNKVLNFNNYNLQF